MNAQSRVIGVTCYIVTAFHQIYDLTIQGFNVAKPFAIRHSS
jgi:hypothetical protein